MGRKIEENVREGVYSSPAISRFQTYERPKRLGVGSGGVTYRISDNLVAKIPSCYSMHLIGREMTLARMLYESGISVPEPRGWENVSVPRVFNEFEIKKAFIMDFVEGDVASSLKNTSWSKLVERLAESEIKKARRLGFVTGDTHSGNYILTPDYKIKLIDFSGWAHPKVPKLERERNDGKIVYKNIINPEEVFA